MPATPSNENPSAQPANEPASSPQRGRALGLSSLVCFAIALMLTLLFVANAVDEFFYGDGGDMAGAPPAMMQMGAIHLTGLAGTILGYLAPADCRLARWGVWSNVILLVVFWLAIAISPV